MNLKDYLKFHKMTFKEFSHKTGIAEAQLNRYANGASYPSLENAFIIYQKSKKQVRLEDWFKRN